MAERAGEGGGEGREGKCISSEGAARVAASPTRFGQWILMVHWLNGQVIALRDPFSANPRDSHRASVRAVVYADTDRTCACHRGECYIFGERLVGDVGGGTVEEDDKNTS